MNLTQPEEIDQILKSKEWQEMKLHLSAADKPASKEARQQGARDAYVSPYRAAYMKLHGFTDQ